MRNFVKEKIKNDEVVLGTFITLNSVELCDIFANAGFDFLMIDYEHGAMGIETVGQQIKTISSTDTTPLLRIPNNDRTNVKKGLDAGAFGIMYPMVNDAEAAKNAVSYFEYPPKGIRGVGATRANLYFNRAEEYFELAEDGLLNIIQIESKEAVENIDEILSVEGIDVIFIGPYDLSFSLGVNGDVASKEVTDAIDKVLEACKRNNVTPGIMAMKDNYEEMVEKGFKFIIVALDGSIIYEAAKSYSDIKI